MELTISNVFALFGGVALFLFGMGIMGDSLKRVAGNSMETVLFKLTNNPLKGVLLGTVVTAVIQSSSATSAMVVGFVNSAMMTVRQAIPIVMGANIGTSITGWILSLSSLEGGGGVVSLLNTANLTAVIAVAGILIRMLSKTLERRSVGDIMLGFAVLMYGMQAMSGAVSPLKESQEFISLMTMFENPILGILVGVLITAVLQSNSASVGILQAISMTGAINFATAMPIIMGMGIGAAVPVLLCAIGANRDSKRVALSYLFNDLFGTIICSVVFYTANHFAHFELMNMIVSPVSIALINSLFRVVSIAALLPCLRWMEKLTWILIPDKTPVADQAEDIDRLEDRFIDLPALAVEQSRMVLGSMAHKAQENLLASFDLLAHYSDAGFQAIQDRESAVDRYEDKLGTYLIRLTAKELTKKQTENVSKFLHTLGDFERISDHAVNIAEGAQEIHQKDVVFSDEAQQELSVIQAAVTEILRLAVTAFTTEDLNMAYRVEPLEEIIDDLCDEMKLHHIDRLQKGTCKLTQGFVFNDLLTNYERVSDHCSNIAVAMIELESDSFDTHAYIDSLKKMKTHSFDQYFEEYKQRFAL